MTSEPDPENFRFGMPFGDIDRLNLQLQALSRSGPDTGDGTLAGCTGDEPSLFQLDRQEQLANEVFGLVQEIKLKLENYLAFQAAYTRDETLKLETASAVAWVGTTIEDVVATIVGVEVMLTKSAGHPES